MKGYTWRRVRYAESVIREKFHGDGLTAADHEKIRDMCRSVLEDKRGYLWARMSRYIPKAQLDYYFNCWEPNAARRDHDLDPGTPFSFSTATGMSA